MEAIRIVFIGAGNMAQALLSGLRQQNTSLALHAIDPSETAREQVNRTNGVACSSNILDAQEHIKNADTVVLAIKPQVMPDVLDALKPIIRPRQLVLSIAAGILSTQMTRRLYPEQPIIRAMPNTPALINAGISGLYANDSVNEHQRLLAERILGAAGEYLWLENERDIDAVTAVSGSGPAYFFYLLEAMVDGGVAAGLTPEVALKLALNTGYGATTMALQMASQNNTLPITLREQVTSPGGTTEAAVNRLNKGHFKATIVSAILKAQQRGATLAQQSETPENSENHN